MRHLTPSSLLAYARTLEGRDLETIWQKKPFSLAVSKEAIYIIPRSQKNNQKPLPITRRTAEWACSEYKRTKSLRPSNYTNRIGVASYVVTIIDSFMREAD